ncbi:hypothetical protein [Edaphobacter aggregans]|uniref:hypothetical protein n=1 Tax=Edaphobacter aggregans TaxID=570835 RepID=UPI0012FC919A|nr:hypothetical protein [Edaphobacter aggregans]
MADLSSPQSQGVVTARHEDGAPHAEASSANESSAEFLKGVSADQAESGRANNSGAVGLGSLQRPPHPGGEQVQTSNIDHPIRPSSEATKPQAFEGPPKEQLQEFIDGADPYPSQRPSVVEHDIANTGLKLYDPKNSHDSGTPSNVREGSPGFIPTDEKRLTTHPDYADYKQRRPEQTLSHFSSVMLYHANKAKTNPTEVQYGYLRDGNNNLKLYSSANSYRGQQWLKENSSVDKLLQNVKEAAAQDENPDVKRHALKLLNFQENQQARRNDVKNDPNLSKEDKKKQLSELDQSDELHKEFFTGTHHVVTNTAAATQTEEGKKSKKKAGKGQESGSPVEVGKAADKKVQRHAEQNIAEQMHADAPTGGLAEIAGTKIRCGSCNSALGPSMKDDKEGYYITGQYYGGQSSKSSIEKTVARDVGRGRPVFKTSTKTGARSSSTSPARLGEVSGSNAYYQFRPDIKPPGKPKA